jgi:hypothetical protein
VILLGQFLSISGLPYIFGLTQSIIMRRTYIACLYTALIITSYTAIAQTDSVFLKSQIEPITGKSSISYKKKQVAVRNVSGSRLISFGDIERIKTDNGRVYVTKVHGKDNELLLLLVKGHYSLLFNDQNQLFYFERNNSLLVVSHHHFHRALPVIFGEHLMQAFYEKFRTKAVYNVRYFTKLALFANQRERNESVTFQENINRFKASVHIGPYFAYSLNRTAFDIYSGYVNGKLVYETTDFVSSNSVPLGIRVDLNLSKKIGIDLGIYMNQTTRKNLNIAETGIYQNTYFFQYSQEYKNFERDIKTRAFSFKTFHLDLALNVMLARDERSKFKPYLFAGPTIARMLENEIQQAIAYKDTDQHVSYFSRWMKLDIRQYMIGINGGLGIDYALNKRITFNASAKFVGGIYPKIRGLVDTSKKQNDTSLADRAFRGFYDSDFEHTFDQLFRAYSFGISTTYKL